LKEEENPKLIVETLGDLTTTKSAKLYLRFNNMGDANLTVKALRPVFKTFGGDTPVIVVATDKRDVMQLARELWIDSASPVIRMLKDKLGEENVKLVES